MNLLDSVELKVNKGISHMKYTMKPVYILGILLLDGGCSNVCTICMCIHHRANSCIYVYTANHTTLSKCPSRVCHIYNLYKFHHLHPMSILEGHNKYDLKHHCCYFHKGK